jgi:hypothetical protein
MKSHCNKCGGPREHKILHEHKASGTEEISEDFSFYWNETYRLLQCAGCETISMREDASNSENTDEEGRPLITTKFLPPRIFRPKPKWMEEMEYVSECPEQIQSLLNETYICLQNDCCSTAAMCVRAILEGVMIDKIGDQRNFTANINEFEKQGYISKRQQEIIEPVLEAGHASIHRGFVPKADQIITLVDVVESIVLVVYVQPTKAAALKKKIPPKN